MGRILSKTSLDFERLPAPTGHRFVYKPQSSDERYFLLVLITARLSEKRSVQENSLGSDIGKEETVQRVGSIFLLLMCKICSGHRTWQNYHVLKWARVAGNCAFVAGMCARCAAWPASFRKAAARFKTLTALRNLFSNGASIPLRSSLPVG